MPSSAGLATKRLLKLLSLLGGTANAEEEEETVTRRSGNGPHTDRRTTSVQTSRGRPRIDGRCLFSREFQKEGSWNSFQISSDASYSGVPGSCPRTRIIASLNFSISPFSSASLNFLKSSALRFLSAASIGLLPRRSSRLRTSQISSSSDAIAGCPTLCGLQRVGVWIPEMTGSVDMSKNSNPKIPTLA